MTSSFLVPPSRRLSVRQMLARLTPAPDNERWRYLSYLLPLTELRMPVASLRGPARSNGRQATLLVAGSEAETGYLPDRFFAEAPCRTVVGQTSIWRLPQLLARLRGSADLVIARVDGRSVGRFSAGDYLVVPDWVTARVPLPLDLAALAQRSTSVATDLRATQRSGLTPEISLGSANFDEFYRRMYLPYMRNRHGTQAHLRNARHLRRTAERGGIIWLERDGARVAGVLFERKGDALDVVALGVAGGELNLLTAGVLAALYPHLIRYAQEQGCAWVNLGGSRPSLRDGVLRYKAKWGAALDATRAPLYCTLVSWNRLDGAVAEFLAETPLIFRDGEQLSALGCVPRNGSTVQADARQTHARLWVDGLRRLYLIDPHTALDGGPRALLAAIDRGSGGA